LRRGFHAARERRAFLFFALHALVTEALAGLPRGQLFVVRRLRHRRHALAEGGALLAVDVLLALVLAVAAVRLRLFRQARSRTRGGGFGRVVRAFALAARIFGLGGDGHRRRRREREHTYDHCDLEVALHLVPPSDSWSPTGAPLASQEVKR